MKRFIIVLSVLSIALSACSSEEESAVGDPVEEPVVDVTEDSETNVVKATEEYHQFEVGPSLAERRKTNEEARKEIEEVFAKELARMSSESTLISTKIDTVEIDVIDAELYDFAFRTHLQIDFAVENTVNEPKQLPLERAIVVTNTGVQAEGERHLSDAPEWDMKGAVKSEGFVVFDLGKEPIEDIESVTLIIPGVDFRSDLEQRIEINF